MYIHRCIYASIITLLEKTPHLWGQVLHCERQFACIEMTYGALFNREKTFSKRPEQFRSRQIVSQIIGYVCKRVLQAGVES